MASPSYLTSAALGAFGYILQRAAAGGALREVDTRDLGYDLAAFLDIYHVSLAQVERRDLVGVVQRGTFYGGARQKHRLEVGDGGYGTRTPYLICYLEQSRDGLLGLELVCYGPLRGFGRESEGAAVTETVDLDHYAVGREWQCLARRVPVADIFVDLLGVAAD